MSGGPTTRATSSSRKSRLVLAGEVPGVGDGRRHVLASGPPLVQYDLASTGSHGLFLRKEFLLSLVTEGLYYVQIARSGSGGSHSIVSITRLHALAISSEPVTLQAVTLQLQCGHAPPFRRVQ